MIRSNQTLDQQGLPITSGNNPILITSATTTTIFPDEGVLLGAGIWKDVDGGTFYFTDSDDDPIPGLPHVTAKGVTDLIGTLPVGRLELSNGLKVVTVATTGIVMSVYSFIAP